MSDITPMKVSLVKAKSEGFECIECGKPIDKGEWHYSLDDESGLAGYLYHVGCYRQPPVAAAPAPSRDSLPLPDRLAEIERRLDAMTPTKPRLRLIYLASRYSDPDPAVRQRRYEMAVRATADLQRKHHDCVIFSPIVHSHPLVAHGHGTDWATWEAHDKRIIDACDELWVLCADRWEASVGIKGEMKHANETAKRIRFIAWSEISQAVTCAHCPNTKLRYGSDLCGTCFQAQYADVKSPPDEAGGES